MRSQVVGSQVVGRQVGLEQNQTQQHPVFEMSHPRLSLTQSSKTYVFIISRLFITQIVRLFVVDDHLGTDGILENTRWLEWLREWAMCDENETPRRVYRLELQEAPPQHSKPSYVRAGLTAGCRGGHSYGRPGPRDIMHHVLVEYVV
jgi:hypothetical protein